MQMAGQPRAAVPPSLGVTIQHRGSALAAYGEEVDAEVLEGIEAVYDALEADSRSVGGHREGEVLGLRLELVELLHLQAGGIVEVAEATGRVGLVDGREDVVGIDAAPRVVLEV